ncbi:MAG: hypothetical protein WCL38_02870 [Actinomycetota bacterium]
MDNDVVEVEGCRGCGALQFNLIETPEGRIPLCPSCVAASDLGCP